MIKGVRGANAGGEGDKHTVAPVVRGGGAEVEGPFAVSCPRLPHLGGVMDDDELSWRMDGVGGEIVDGTMQAVPGRDRGL